MAYSITILRRAQKELSSLPKEDYQRVRDAILKLGETPRPDGTLKMTGRPAWRIRVGDYRVRVPIANDLTNCQAYSLAGGIAGISTAWLGSHLENWHERGAYV